MSKKIVMICTSCVQVADTEKETGCWMEEVAAPYYLWTSKGYEVTIASIKGGKIPFDKTSLGAPYLTPEAEKFLADATLMKLVNESVKLDDVNIADYAAVFLPGGHGVCFDFPQNELLGKKLSDAWQAGKVVSAVCHGPNGLVNVKDAAGVPIVKGKKVTGFTNTEEKAVAFDGLAPFSNKNSYIVQGKKVTGFTNTEEKAVALDGLAPFLLIQFFSLTRTHIVQGKKVTGFTNTEEEAVALDGLVPFLLEDKLKELGGTFEGGPDWNPFAVRDGNLVTGQNPASSTKCAELVMEALAA
eukprot:gene19040-25637_t